MASDTDDPETAAERLEAALERIAQAAAREFALARSLEKSVRQTFWPTVPERSRLATARARSTRRPRALLAWPVGSRKELARLCGSAD